MPEAMSTEARAGLAVPALARALCLTAVVFASGDLWPSITIGFTFRFAQLCMLAALAILLAAPSTFRIRSFPGIWPLFGFALWVVITLPLSIFIQRSVGYVFWVLTNTLLVFTFVQCFRSERMLRVLVRWFLVSFILMSLFGMAQFALGLLGVDVLVTEWWIPGRLPRVNGLTYEPSYFGTYLVPGWVLSLYLLEKRAPEPSRALLKLTALSTTLGLLICSSRIGWISMILWLLFRAFAAAARALARGSIKRRSVRPLLMAGAVVFGTLVAGFVFRASILPKVQGATVIFQGLGLFGETSHSATTRTSDLAMTWNAFLRHPVVGTGIGALPMEIGAQKGEVVFTLEDAKQNEGTSIFVELLASTGLVGALLMLSFALALWRRCHVVSRNVEEWRRRILAGLGWSCIWILLALQFSPTFLRIYLFVDIAVFCCFMTVTRSPERHVSSTHETVASNWRVA